jgi:hypothetical protein
MELGHLPSGLRRRVPLELIGAATPNATVIRAKGDAPLFQGVAEADYVCGSCGAVLCSGIGIGRLAGFLFECWCGAVNRVPPLV